MRQIDPVLNDRGSKYAVTVFDVVNEIDVKQAITILKSKKKFAKATHNTWAVIFEDEDGRQQRIKNDDGESGAGMVILNMLQQQGLVNQVVIVTRWYGGTKLGGDRFRHVQRCVRAYIEGF